MSTDRIAERNRRNAKRSTGPTSAGGKARSRLNALKNGLTAKTLLLPGEDADYHKLLEEALRADLEPVGGVAEVIFAEVHRDAIRLSRIEAAEASLLVTEMKERNVQRAFWRTRRIEDRTYELANQKRAEEPSQPDSVCAGATRVSAIEKALREHLDLQETRDGPASDMSVVFANGAESLRLNDRYRTSAMNRFLRGVERLLQMKEARERLEGELEDEFADNLALIGEAK